MLEDCALHQHDPFKSKELHPGVHCLQENRRPLLDQHLECHDAQAHELTIDNHSLQSPQKELDRRKSRQSSKFSNDKGEAVEDLEANQQRGRRLLVTLDNSEGDIQKASAP